MVYGRGCGMTANNKWTFKMTPVRKVLIGLAAICLLVVGYRLAFGLGSATNLNDQWPWGLWIGFDVLTGVALAGGGYSTALIVHILHRNQFNPGSQRHTHLIAGLPVGHGRVVLGYRQVVQLLAALCILGLSQCAV